jgi:hypothetical protein
LQPSFCGNRLPRALSGLAGSFGSFDLRDVFKPTASDAPLHKMNFVARVPCRRLQATQRPGVGVFVEVRIVDRAHEETGAVQ